MNARVELTTDDTTLRRALHAVLHSPLFVRAPQTCNLLAFLVDKKLAGKEHEITEHAIGLAVFRRDVRCYDTALDPIVRVQMGRLRTRLVQFYSGNTGGGPRVTIPPGSYVPVFVCGELAEMPALESPLQLTLLRNLAIGHANMAFVAGVDEELGSRLFDAFGSLIQLPCSGTGWLPGGTMARHRLEGSIRVEYKHVRASMRLVDTRHGDIAWLADFDCIGELDMRLQEILARNICAKLQSYFTAIKQRIRQPETRQFSQQ